MVTKQVIRAMVTHDDDGVKIGVSHLDADNADYADDAVDDSDDSDDGCHVCQARGLPAV